MPDMEKMCRGRDDFLRAMHAEIEKDKPDMNAIGTMMKERLGTFPERMEKHIDLFKDFYDTLSEEQQSQALGWLRKTAKRRH